MSNREQVLLELHCRVHSLLLQTGLDGFNSDPLKHIIKTYYRGFSWKPALYLVKITQKLHSMMRLTDHLKLLRLQLQSYCLQNNSFAVMAQAQQLLYPLKFLKE